MLLKFNLLKLLKPVILYWYKLWCGTYAGLSEKVEGECIKCIEWIKCIKALKALKTLKALKA